MNIRTDGKHTTQLGRIYLSASELTYTVHCVGNVIRMVEIDDKRATQLASACRQACPYKLNCVPTIRIHYIKAGVPT